MAKNMWNIQQRGSDSGRIITNLAKEKLRKGKTICKKYLQENLLGDGHNGLFNDIEVAFIDKIDPSDPLRW